MISRLERSTTSQQSRSDTKRFETNHQWKSGFEEEERRRDIFVKQKIFGFSHKMEESGIGDARIALIAASLEESNVKSLRLYGNYIGAAGARALAGVLKESSITELQMGYNEIGDAGAVALAAALKESKLTTLRLVGNMIGDEGAKALAAALPDSKLKQLWLCSNLFGREGTTALAEAFVHSRLASLWVGDTRQYLVDAARTRRETICQLFAFCGVSPFGTPHAKFRRRDGDTAAQHRITAFLV